MEDTIRVLYLFKHIWTYYCQCGAQGHALQAFRGIEPVRLWSISALGAPELPFGLAGKHVFVRQFGEKNLIIPPAPGTGSA